MWQPSARLLATCWRACSYERSTGLFGGQCAWPFVVYICTDRQRLFKDRLSLCSGPCLETRLSVKRKTVPSDDSNNTNRDSGPHFSRPCGPRELRLGPPATWTRRRRLPSRTLKRPCPALIVQASLRGVVDATVSFTCRRLHPVRFAPCCCFSPASEQGCFSGRQA